MPASFRRLSVEDGAKMRKLKPPTRIIAESARHASSIPWTLVIIQNLFCYIWERLRILQRQAFHIGSRIEMTDCNCGRISSIIRTRYCWELEQDTNHLSHL